MGRVFHIKGITFTKVENQKRKHHIPETDSWCNWILEYGLERRGEIHSGLGWVVVRGETVKKWPGHKRLVNFVEEFVYLRRRQWYPTPVLLPGKSHGRRSLVGCSPWVVKSRDMTEWLHFHFSLLCIGEGNGNPLQCSCLENPRDGVAQSRTRLKWLSSSSCLS